MNFFNKWYPHIAFGLAIVAWVAKEREGAIWLTTISIYFMVSQCLLILRNKE